MDNMVVQKRRRCKGEVRGQRRKEGGVNCKVGAAGTSETGTALEKMQCGITS